MKFTAIVATGLLASANAFSPSSAGFTTQTYGVGERTVGPMQQGTAHSQRRATIVMDGKANGASSRPYRACMATHAYIYMGERDVFVKIEAGNREIFSDSGETSRERPRSGRHSMVGNEEKSSYVGISTDSTWGYVFPSCWE